MMIRKIPLSITPLLLALVTTAYAAENKSPSCVSVPCYNGGFTFGLAGLYLQPSTSTLDYSVIFPTSGVSSVFPNGTNDEGRVKSVNPTYDFGYRANLGYLFPCSGNDVLLTYNYFNRNRTNSVVLQPNEVLVGTIAPFQFSESTFTSASSEAKSEFRYQTVDLDFGQHINLGCSMHLRFLGGLRYADLDSKFIANYFGVIEAPFADDEIFTIKTSQKSEYSGIGPRLGIDGEYNLGCGFGLVGQAATALLIGDIKSHFGTDEVIVAGTPLVNNITFREYPNTTRIVPNLTGKLGLDYHIRFCNCSHSVMTIEAGYQVDHFFNSIDRLGSVDLGFGVVDDRNLKHTIDTSFAGPYLGIQVRV